jgi:hypothetical protein
MMAASDLLDFLRLLRSQRELLSDLSTRTKDEVCETASTMGYSVAAEDFDLTVWPLEMELAKKRGEEFGPNFSLWNLMWGRYYLEFVVDDVLPSFTDAELERVRSGKSAD